MKDLKEEMVEKVLKEMLEEMAQMALKVLKENLEWVLKAWKVIKVHLELMVCPVCLVNQFY